jgi:hypothetical protein
MVMAEEMLQGRQRYPFCTAVTLKVWRRTCGETGRLIDARFAIARTARWIVRTPMPNSSWSAKCPSRSGCTRAESGITRRFDFVP